MGKTFQKIHGCSVGSFEGNGDKIHQWIRANGGSYSKDVSSEVTHLIVTKEAYKKNVGAVREAKRLRTVKIVTYDWLEDSLLSKSRRPKREKPYLLDTVLKGERKKGQQGRKGTQAKSQTKKSRKKTAAQSLDIFEGSCLSTKTKMEALNYHLYSDKSTNVTYCATLVRPTAFANQREKYLLKTFNSHLYETQPRHPGHYTNVSLDNPHAQQLQVYESNSEPRVYAAYVKYSRVGKAATHLLAPLGSSLDLAMKAFKQFFLLRTGREWDQRFDETPVPPMKDAEGNILPAHEGWYQHENQMGLLASFLRNGPGETVGVDERDPDSLITGSSERHEGVSEQQEDKE
ncbi:brct domain protein [Aspergillus sp. HF37]|nr:brct domain protein [Aspergillus sp. HF37]